MTMTRRDALQRSIGALGAIAAGLLAAPALAAARPSWRATDCTRTPGHDGPCNGWPCPARSEALERQFCSEALEKAWVWCRTHGLTPIALEVSAPLERRAISLLWPSDFPIVLLEGGEAISHWSLIGEDEHGAQRRVRSFKTVDGGWSHWTYPVLRPIETGYWTRLPDNLARL